MLPRRTLLRSAVAAIGATILAAPAGAEGEPSRYRLVGWADYVGEGADIHYIESDVGPEIGGDHLVTRVAVDRIRVTDAHGGFAREYVGDGSGYDALLERLNVLVEPATPFGTVPQWLEVPRAELVPFVSDGRAEGAGLSVLLLTEERAVILVDLASARGVGYGSADILARVGSPTMAAIAAGEDPTR
jgi:hypothetical protein